MASKYQAILTLADKQARDISASVPAYTRFLTTAGNNYKYSFQDQLLIHAQKPEATACATLEKWNELGRWINRHTKGIALMSDGTTPYRLRYVFDISDTNSYAGNVVRRWAMEERFEPAVTEALENSFGEQDAHSFPQLLMDVAGVAAIDNYPDYLPDLANQAQDSLLEDLDDYSLEVWFKTSLSNSVAYMMLTRCGYDPEKFFQLEDFSHVMDFNTPHTIAILGEAINDIAGMLLREIERTVRSAQREERKARTFAIPPEPLHNGATEKLERSQDHGTDLHETGRLPVSKSDSSREPEGGQIRDAAPDLPAEPSPGLYTGMMLSQTLNAHLEEIDGQANEMMGRMTRQMAKEQGVTEALKASNQMEWVRQMNAIRSSAEEVVMRQLIYS